MTNYDDFHKELRLTSDIDDVINAFAYQGFNPEVIHAELARIEPEARTRRTDIVKMITFFVTRGPNYAHQLTRTSTQGEQLLRPILTKYNVREKKVADPRAITSSRILATYPLIAMRLCNRGPGNYRDPCPNTSPALAHRYRFLQAPAINISDQNFALWLIWAKDVDRIINGDKADENAVERFAEIMRRAARVDVPADLQ